MFVRQVKKKGTGEQVPQNLDRARTAIARVSMIFKEWHRPGWSTLTMPWAVRRELVMDLSWMALALVMERPDGRPHRIDQSVAPLWC